MTETKETKKIKETKATCKACGEVWYYGKADAIKNFGDKMSDAGKGMMCCGGCLPKSTQRDLSKCPKCGSSAVDREEVIHEV